MAVTLLEIARIFATKVPGKIDADVLQLLWKVDLLFSSSFECCIEPPTKLICKADLLTYSMHITISSLQHLMGCKLQFGNGFTFFQNVNLNLANSFKKEQFLPLQTCLVGAGPDGKHRALEAVTIVLDLPPPQPGSMSGLTSVDMVSASDPKSAIALQRLVQAAVRTISTWLIYSLSFDLGTTNILMFRPLIIRFGFQEKMQIMLHLSMPGSLQHHLVLH